tara:strand:- start:592 stop:807 length:216 start_codon:yes stop_codon:yes gene_type:complete
MAKIHAISFHSGGQVHSDLEAQTPADLASEWGLSMNEVEIFVNEDKGALSTELRDGDFVSFQRNKVTSGNQ